MDETKKGVADSRNPGDSRKPADLQRESVKSELNAVMAKLKNDKLFKRGMAEPEFLKQKAAIDRQNSFLKSGSKKQHQQHQLDDFPNRQNSLKRQPANHFRSADLDSEEDEKPKDILQMLNAKNKPAGGRLMDFDQGAKKRLPNQPKLRERPYKGNGGRVRGGGGVRGEGGWPEGNGLGRIPALGSFDVEAYLAPQRLTMGTGDNMKKFQFNQEASDSTPPDRYLKDYRNGL